MIQVHTDLSNLPKFQNAVITIGTFDGVHLGHQQIIQQLIKSAAYINGETVIITFDPHPRTIVGTYSGKVSLINTLEEKIFLLNKVGIHHLVIVPFTSEFAQLSAEAYCKEFIFNYFAPHTIIIGYDHRFGKSRTGDYHLLEEIGLELGFKVTEIDEKVLDSSIISSTRIRTALFSNDIHTANQFLGYPYFFSGTVIKGNQLGRTIGYPTANIHVENAEKLIPADGVYAVTVVLNNAGKQLKGMMNIGLRPTVDGKKRMIEVNIFDFNQNIYDQNLQINVHHFLRNEVKFNGIETLVAQLEADAIQSKELLAGN